MGPVRCYYHNCSKNSTTKSMFTFPVDKDTRLNAWINNSGNNLLKSLTREELRHRFICEDHFDARDVLKNHCRSRLVPTAVPIPWELDPNKPQKQIIPTKCKYRNCRNTRKTHSLYAFPIKDEHRLQIWIKNSGNPKLAKLRPESLYTRFLCGDHFDQCYKNSNSTQARLVGTAVPRPYEGEESNNIESEDSNDTESEHGDNEYDAVESEDTDYVPVYENSCMECKKPIMGFGFQWWCLQCAGARCSVCIMRLVHRPHFVLRLPANIKSKQVEIVIAAIQNELELEGFFTPEEDKDLDQGETADVDTDEIEQILNEPPVKAEPPDEEEDPLAECYNSPDSEPKETPTIDYSILAEDRPDSQSNDLRQGENSGLDESLKTHDIKSYPSRKAYRPSKSLGLGNIKYGLNKKYSGLDNTECSSQKTVPIVKRHSIDYQPFQNSGLEVSIGYQSIYMPLGLEDSFEFQSQFLGLDSLYDITVCDDIRHSASLQSAPVGPVSHVPVGVLNPGQTDLKLSGSGSGVGKSSVQSGSGLQKLVPDKLQPANKDLHPPSNKRIRVLNDSIDFETELDCTTTQLINIDHRPQPEQGSLTEDALNSTEIIQLNNGPKNKRKLTDTKQNIGHNKTQEIQVQVVSHKKQSCTETMKKRDLDKQKSINSSENLKNKPKWTTEVSKRDSNKMQHPQIQVYSTHKKQNYNITQKGKDSKTQKPQFQVYSTHKKLNCTDISDTSVRKNSAKIQPMNFTEQDNEIKTRFQVFSTHKAKKKEI